MQPSSYSSRQASHPVRFADVISTSSFPASTISCLLCGQHELDDVMVTTSGVSITSQPLIMLAVASFHIETSLLVDALALPAYDSAGLILVIKVFRIYPEPCRILEVTKMVLVVFPRSGCILCPACLCLGPAAVTEAKWIKNDTILMILEKQLMYCSEFSNEDKNIFHLKEVPASQPASQPLSCHSAAPQVSSTPQNTQYTSMTDTTSNNVKRIDR
uniref:Uncharacterized protein n=1 Tax=Timema genevievae TaxID=629358 RepID=A0A7R9PQJ5_TIMGE|nr:unnamed protein product [Timema genevievae]